MRETPARNGSGQATTARSPTAVLETMAPLEPDRTTRTGSEDHR